MRRLAGLALCASTLLVAGSAAAEGVSAPAPAPAYLGFGIALVDPMFNDAWLAVYEAEAALSEVPDPFFLLGEIPVAESAWLVLRGAYSHTRISQAELERLNNSGENEATTEGGGAEAWRLGAAAGARWRFARVRFAQFSTFGLLAWDARSSTHEFTYKATGLRAEGRRSVNAVSLSLGTQVEVPLFWGFSARAWFEVLDARTVWGGHTTDKESEPPRSQYFERFLLSADLTTTVEVAYAF